MPAALQEVEPFVDQREQRVATAFSGWFTFGDVPGRVVPNWKQAMIALLALFPVVMLELIYLSPLLRALDPAVATIIVNLLSVAALTWMLVPWANRAFDWWLLSNAQRFPTGGGLRGRSDRQPVRPVCRRVRLDQLSGTRSAA